MKVYNILQQHPEWAADPKAHRAEVGDYAHTYIWELFKLNEQLRDSVLWHDLNKIMEVREALIAFCGLDGEADQTTESQRQADLNKIAILERLIKAICWQLADYSYCLDNTDVERFYLENDGDLAFIAIEEWPTSAIGQEVFAGIKENEKTSKAKYLKGIDENKAKSIYNGLKDANIIDCTEDDFLWYFSTSKATARATQTPPDKLEWKPTAINTFAYFGIMLFEKCYNAQRVNWAQMLNTFAIKCDPEQLKSAKNGIKNGRDSYPNNATDIDKAFNFE